MKNKKSKFFKTIPEVLKSDTSNSLKQIRSVSIENQYWSNIFKQAFDEMPHDFTELNKSILRISKLKSNMSIANDLTEGISLNVRLSSNGALTRFKLVTPKLINILNGKGLNVALITSSLGVQK